MNADAETQGQRALRELAKAIGYSDGADAEDEGGIDALIDYKNVLEDRLAGRIDAAAEIRRLADRRGSFRGTTYYVRLVNAERVMEQIAELAESDGGGSGPALAGAAGEIHPAAPAPRRPSGPRP